MKRAALIAILVTALLAAGYAQEAPEETASPKSKSLGLTAKLNYVSAYLWRGTYFYGGDGAFLPSVSWDIFNTGAVVSAVSEISQGYIFEGKRRSTTPLGFARHGLDAGVDYSHTFEDMFTLGAGFWYFWYYNSGQAGVLLKKNESFLSPRFFLRIDILPLKPTATVYYDYYTAQQRGGDFYVTLTLSHSFELTSEVSLGISFNTGYYYKNTAHGINVTGVTLESIRFDSVKKGFSDISTLVNLTYHKGMVAITTGFGYVAVPAKSWYKGSDVHRFYATFGASLMF